MHNRNLIPNICLLLTAAVGFSQDGLAQGLIFNLPEDGKGIKYVGTVAQTFITRDPSTEAMTEEVINKAREMTIKSVGRVEEEFNGEKQPCRWIEIKVTTGTQGAAGIDPGPVGARIYKVLVPESKVIAEPVDDDSIPNIILPLVRGYRRNGEGEVHQIKSNGLGLYPTVCQLRNYTKPEVISESETPETKAVGVSVTARHLKGTATMERLESRSTNEADYWVSDEVPFGLVRWNVTVIQERKESTAARADFHEVSKTTSEMLMSEIIDFAESELVTPEG